jgi:AraC-like DNA-binding protein
MRIDRARTMLADASSSLADVACATGFADQSHFTRVFSRVVGMSPGAWRRWQKAWADFGEASPAPISELAIRNNATGIELNA